MKDYRAMDKDTELWVLLGQTSTAMFKARQKELHPYNITARKAAVLYIIQAIGDKATPAEISRWLFRKSHSISELLIRMEKDGLIRKAKDLDRKNLVRVALTEKGHEAYHQSMKRESVQKIMSSLSKKEHQQLKSCLQTLRVKALRELGMEQEIPFPPLVMSDDIW